MRVVFVPSTLALLPAYASIDDPISDLREAVDAAVAWLLEEGPATALWGSGSAHRIAEHLLGERGGHGPGLLVVANGSATRTEKAPGHLDERAAGFDAAVGKALAEGDQAALAAIDTDLADELWAMPDADVLRKVAGRVGPVTDVHVDYDDAPYGVQYWVVRWQCGS
ncbi:hypothetical protein [Nocardioides pocheonensis]|uniref:Uncharacterized protein n=1 Tax=Nocardioides pocheonensis TaxID=661485 RepID=A0A3N0GVT5_9ACTN|nr:hypothetical protein [Nocardioides pocheonensis]RNM16262.1 hypothetical protein EFL26_05750 [Nocardioides pocheonensis]